MPINRKHFELPAKSQKIIKAQRKLNAQLCNHQENDMQGLPIFNPRSDAMKVRDDPGQGDDVPCEKCGAVALDTGLECDECGHDNWLAVTGKARVHNAS